MLQTLLKLAPPAEGLRQCICNFAVDQQNCCSHGTIRQQEFLRQSPAATWTWVTTGAAVGNMCIACIMHISLHLFVPESFASCLNAHPIVLLRRNWLWQVKQRQDEYQALHHGALLRLQQWKHHLLQQGEQPTCCLSQLQHRMVESSPADRLQASVTRIWHTSVDNMLPSFMGLFCCTARHSSDLSSTLTVPGGQVAIVEAILQAFS